LAVCIFTVLMAFAGPIVKVFTNDPELIAQTTPSLRKIFMATPLIIVQLISSAYFQAIGKAIPALLLTLSKQGFFLIPLILILPPFFNLDGVWFAFPIADISAASVSYWYLKREMSNTLDNFVLQA